MKTVCIVVMAAALAAAADAMDFVNEGFEGSSFPPTGWTIASKGNAGWSHYGGGPWGFYAYGWAGSFEEGLVRATLMSYEFYVRPGIRVYYRFDYFYAPFPGHGTSLAEFYIAYVPPPGNLVYRQLPVSEH